MKSPSSFFKKHIGKQLILREISSNGRSLSAQEQKMPHLVEIISVARVYMVAKHNTTDSESTYTMELDGTVFRNNHHYRVFQTLEEFDQSFIADAYAKAICEQMRWRSDWEYLGYEKLKQIAKILEIEITETGR